MIGRTRNLRSMKCTNLLCGRDAEHTLYYKSYNKLDKKKYFCDCCYRAYVLGREHFRKNIQIQENVLLKVDKK